MLDEYLNIVYLFYVRKKYKKKINIKIKNNLYLASKMNLMKLKNCIKIHKSKGKDKKEKLCFSQKNIQKYKKLVKIYIYIN